MSAPQTLTATQVWDMFLATQTDEQKKHLVIPRSVAPPKTNYLNAPKAKAKGLDKWCADYLKADITKAIKISQGNGRLLERMSLLRCWANCLKVKMFLPQFVCVVGWDIVQDNKGVFSADCHTILHHPPTDSWIDLTAYPHGKGDRLFVPSGIKPDWQPGDWLCPDKTLTPPTSIYTKRSEMPRGGDGGPALPEDAEFEIYSNAATELSYLAEVMWKDTLPEGAWGKFLAENSTEPTHKQWWEDMADEGNGRNSELFNKAMRNVQAMWETGMKDKTTWCPPELVRVAHHFRIFNSLNYKGLIRSLPNISLSLHDGNIKVAYDGKIEMEDEDDGLGFFGTIMRLIGQASAEMPKRQAENDLD